MEYSLVFIFDNSGENVLLINKNKGAYAGKLNGVGGSIEPSDKCPRAGALREVFEETGYEEFDFGIFDNLVVASYPSGCTLHVYYGVLGTDRDFEQKESERLEWRSIYDLPNVGDWIWAGEGGPSYFINAALVALGIR